ncbi:hypothetical protein [Streptomyces sp. MST-110588]|uniref:hypothetical protein n=1 Tax=Streptomyces sp. MST-110588 TaxID=2833628 RepID=UPI001F5DCEE1|nr:hypothetical protein [Streptomyces sp. MST-110588]UNO40123.1 hypothetical protein KGS77_11630 [Streptomyces sp. MST-110588]
MSLKDDLTAAQQSLEDLVRSVGRLEQQVGGGLEIRRVRSDTDHLRESLELLREGTSDAPAARSADPAPRLASAPGFGAGHRPAAGPAAVEMVTIPDTPYDAALWRDAEDEGLGARDRRAP